MGAECLGLYWILLDYIELYCIVLHCIEIYLSCSRPLIGYGPVYKLNTSTVLEEKNILRFKNY